MIVLGLLWAFLFQDFESLIIKSDGKELCVHTRGHPPRPERYHLGSMSVSNVAFSFSTISRSLAISIPQDVKLFAIQTRYASVGMVGSFLGRSLTEL